MRSPEFRLAAEACRAAFATDGAAEDVTAVDWTRFVAICRRHRVQGLAHLGLRKLAAPIPVAAAEALTADAKEIAARNLVAIAETGRLLESFEQARLPILFVKGVTLAALAYPEPMVKMNWDIDVLTDPAALPAAARVLGELGYRPVLPAARLESWHAVHKESAWTNGSTYVELHTRLADNPALIPSIDIFSPRQTVALAGQRYAPTLAADELFVYLCVHGASSAWFRLKWITDLSALLHGHAASDIDRLFERSQSLGAGRSSGQALLLANQIHKTRLSPQLEAQLKSDRAVRLMLAFARQQLSGRLEYREPTEVWLGTLGIHASQLWLRPGMRFKAAESIRQVRELVSRSGCSNGRASVELPPI